MVILSSRQKPLMALIAWVADDRITGPWCCLNRHSHRCGQPCSHNPWQPTPQRRELRILFSWK